METKQEILKKLVTGSIFLKPKTKENILGKVDVFAEAQLDALITLMKEAEEKQVFMIQKILEKNPNFLTELEHLAAHEIQKYREGVEQEMRQEEEKTLKNLEDELNNLPE